MPERLNERRTRDLIMKPEVRRSDERHLYRLGHPVMWTLAAVAALGAGWLLVPEVLAATAIGRAIPGPFERVWGLAYSVGGALVLLGFARHPYGAREQVLGLMLLAGAYAAYGYAILAIDGLRPAGIVASILFALAYGCARRAYVLTYEPEFRPWRRRSSS